MYSNQKVSGDFLYFELPLALYALYIKLQVRGRN